MKKIRHLEALYEEGIVPATDNDDSIINEKLDLCFALFYNVHGDDDFKVYDEGSVYLADLKRFKENESVVF